MQPQWLPDPSVASGSAMARFGRSCVAEYGAPIKDGGEDYQSLWAWSVADPTTFWAAVWKFFDVRSSEGYREVLSADPMPRARWFEGARLNYVDQVFRHGRGEDAALIDVAEAADGDGYAERVLSWSQLRQQVAGFSATLRGLGVGAGDRVVGYLPNVAEAVVAFLASASIGAVWASCGQDYAAGAAAARFGQLEPVVMVAADGYRFAGKARDRRDEVRELVGKLPTVRATVLVPRLGLPVDLPSRVLMWADTTAERGELVVDPVASDHPLWVLFSSGTTGRPKGIVHGHGGILLEHLKVLGLHQDMGAGDRFFWYTTPSWMVWNYLVGGLLTGSTVLCYDGSPSWPTPDALWALTARYGVTCFGASPGYVAACQKAEADPGTEYDLSALRLFGSSGSHLPADAYGWLSAHVGSRVQVVSTSGGTDVASAFAGAAPTLPVWPGELSGPCLGVALDAWDPSGRPVRGAVGELVITQPMPSMPLYFWSDSTGEKYREAYFDAYPDVWRHGDWITITERGSVVVHGRSDSTLNRNGVRMGSADIYQVVESLAEVDEALVIGAEQPGGEYWMPLFVRLARGSELDDALAERIRAAIRTHASPRHVPDHIIAVAAIPHTRTGKKLEVPIKRILQGAAESQVVDPGAVDDPTLLGWFARYRTRRLAQTELMSGGTG